LKGEPVFHFLFGTKVGESSLSSCLKNLPDSEDDKIVIVNILNDLIVLEVSTHSGTPSSSDSIDKNSKP
jgi:hypothetical protein